MGSSVRTPLRAPFLAFAIAASLLAPDAWSQDPKELARARERFKEGVALQAAGDFARALEAYKEVAQVKSSAQVRFNMATCEEKLGDYVSAEGTYRLALTEATQSSARVMEASVQSALAALEPRIPTLLLRRGDGAAVADVTLDGKKVSNPSIGVEFQVNPGPHDLRATAPDRLPMALELNLADGEHRVVNLVLKARPVAVAVPVPLATSSPAEEPPPPPPSNNRPLRYAGIGVGALGVVGLVVSGVFFGKRQSAISMLNTDCGPTHMSCPPGDAATFSSGQQDTTVATAMLVTGLVALAAGGTMIGLSMRKPTPKPAAGFVVTPGGGAIYGAF